MSGYWIGRVECGEVGGEESCRLTTVGYLALPYSGFCLLDLLHPNCCPFLLFNWEQNICTQHCFRGCSCIPPPLPSAPTPAQLSPALWDLVKTKSYYRGKSGLAQPTGNTQGHKCEGLLYSAPLVFLERHDNLTLPVLIALKTRKYT